MSESQAAPSSLLRAPFVHVLLLGILLYAAYAWWQKDQAAPRRAPDEIVLDAEEIGALADAWKRKRGRSPSRAELHGLVQTRLREEILSREAIAMGLDRGDPMIRRTLAQKVEFLVDNITSMREPTEAELLAFLDANPERFRRHGRVAFEQRFFNPDRHGAKLDAAVEKAIVALQADPEAEAGDVSMLPEAVPLETEREIANSFGPEFAGAVMALEGEGWLGPVRSTYGTHLVRIKGREAGSQPELEAIRPLVREAVRDEQRRQAETELYERLRERYRIEIDEAAIERRTPQDAAR